MSETALMRDILVALPGPPVGIWWRQNVGVGVAPGKRVIRFGVPGMADIGGCYRGRHVEIEVKAPRGRQSDQQKLWAAAITKVGGIYVLARSVEQVLAELAAVGELP